MTADSRPPRARGQLVVVGAIVLSILLVGVAVQLNGVLFVEHESQAEHRTTEPVQVAAAATTAVSEAMTTVNVANGTSYAGVASNVMALVARWERAAAARHATDGVDISVAVRDVRVAARVTDGNDSSPLTSADDLDDWTLASNVTELGEARLSLSGDDLTTQDDPGPCSVWSSTTEARRGCSRSRTSRAATTSW